MMRISNVPSAELVSGLPGGRRWASTPRIGPVAPAGPEKWSNAMPSESKEPCLAAVMLILTLCMNGCGNLRSGSEPCVTVADIESLGPTATMEDVTRLLRNTPLTKLPMFEVAASEGGLYVFVFMQTNEVEYKEMAHATSMPLVAVVATPSHEAYMRGDGHYVYPRHVRGKRFTGVPVP
jgi:hypothetical protein